MNTSDRVESLLDETRGAEDTVFGVGAKFCFSSLSMDIQKVDRHNHHDACNERYHAEPLAVAGSLLRSSIGALGGIGVSLDS